MGGLSSTKRYELAGKIASLKIRTGIANVIILKKKLDEDCMTTMNALEARLCHAKKSNGVCFIITQRKELAGKIVSLKIRTGIANVIILKKKLDEDCMTTINALEGGKIAPYKEK